MIFLFFILCFVNTTCSDDCIMSYEEYALKQHDIPYMYTTVLRSDQLLFYFGANHSCDPKNEQYLYLDCFLDEFYKKHRGKIVLF